MSRTETVPARSSSATRRPTSAGVAARVLSISEAIMWAARVNFAWLLLTITGGVVFGIGPATVAVVTICRDRSRTGHEARLREFFLLFGKEFWRANRLMLPVIVVDALLATALTLAVQFGSVLITIGAGAVVLVAVLATVVLPVLYAHYDIPLGRCVPTATRFVLANPISMLVLALACAAIVVVTMLCPALLFFLSIGVWLQISTALCLSFFHQNDQRVAMSSGDPGETQH